VAAFCFARSRFFEVARVFVRLDHVALTDLTHFRIFARNLAPDFTHYFSERPEIRKQDESKNHQQNPVSETSVSSIAAVYSLDAVWY
jgi:hypothetical protein